MIKGNRVRFYTDIKCDSCKTTIEKAFEGKDLYTEFEVDYTDPKRVASFTLRDGVKPEEIKRLINEAGYKAEVVEETDFIKKEMNDERTR